jgi:ribosomal protein S20
MSKNTVKDTLTPKPRAKRSKREVENAQFEAFVRRILRAYARRVAAGDVEALHSLSALSSEVDAVTRLAVAGLRKAPYSYSWSEIADRLGISKQAAQQRYGERTDRGALDRRLLEAGLSVSVATLVQVFADHHPGIPAASVCPGCGYRYPDGVLNCPTNATVRPLLLRRRGEDREAVARLNPEQFEDLLKANRSKVTRAATRRPAEPPTTPAYQATSLFDLAGKDPQ